MYRMMKADRDKVEEKIMEAGIGIVDLAEKVGISINTLAKLRVGDEVRTCTMDKFCRALDISLEEIDVQIVWRGVRKTCGS